jgi:hypothetical protein
MENTNAAYLPRTTERGVHYPKCVVCGRDLDREVTFIPTLDDLRVNETCDRCWLWFVSTEDDWTTAS